MKRHAAESATKRSGDCCSFAKNTGAMKKTRNLISICSSVFAILWGSMPARAQVPPPSDPVVVMIYCPHCGWVDVEKGETHRADCPSRGSVSASGGSSSRSSSSVDPALSAAVSQVRSNAPLGESWKDEIEEDFRSRTSRR